jgi:arylsulfatase A-like enzyme
MLKALDDLGWAENTIVMYSTDNGACRDFNGVEAPGGYGMMPKIGRREHAWQIC